MAFLPRQEMATKSDVRQRVSWQRLAPRLAPLLVVWLTSPAAAQVDCSLLTGTQRAGLHCAPTVLQSTLVPVPVIDPTPDTAARLESSFLTIANQPTRPVVGREYASAYPGARMRIRAILWDAGDRLVVGRYTTGRLMGQPVVFVDGTGEPWIEQDCANCGS